MRLLFIRRIRQLYVSVEVAVLVGVITEKRLQYSTDFCSLSLLIAVF